MAIVLMGGGITQMSGSIGGNTFARTPAGCDLRTRRKPIQKKSVLQQHNKTVFQSLCNQWRHPPMSNARHDTWNQYANSTIMHNRLGEQIHLTGYQHFMRSNIARTKCDLAIVYDGPAPLGLPEGPRFFQLLHWVEKGYLIVWWSLELFCMKESGGAMMSYICNPQSGSVNFCAKPFVYFGRILGTDIEPWGHSAAFFPPPFPLIDGQKVWAQGRVIRADGRISKPFISSPCVIGTDVVE